MFCLSVEYGIYQVSDVYRILKPGDGWPQFREIQSIAICDDNSIAPDSLLGRVPSLQMY
jgi:hypothetical protein